MASFKYVENMWGKKSMVMGQTQTNPKKKKKKTLTNRVFLMHWRMNLDFNGSLFQNVATYPGYISWPDRLKIKYGDAQKSLQS